MYSLKKGERVQLLNFEGGPVVSLLNFEEGPGSRVPRSQVTGLTFTPCHRILAAFDIFGVFTKFKFYNLFKRRDV